MFLEVQTKARDTDQGGGRASLGGPVSDSLRLVLSGLL